ncbi:MAG: GTPase Era [Deltaproteobacteria bacterium]|nr:GTPase Era [Deltaproteobacteria bacterium]
MSDSNTQTFLSGFIAIVGPPNAGKSKLLNRILGSKVSIVSPKPQTTRNRLMGIYHGDGYQMAFMDTPGIHRTKTLLHKSMVSSAIDSMSEVDIIMVVIDIFRPDDAEITMILSALKKSDKRPAVLIVNKIDAAKKEKILETLDHFSKINLFDSIIPVSALRGDGIETVIKELRKRLKPGPEFFPREMITDQPETFLISEIIREKIYLNTKNELPYSAAVTVDYMQEDPYKDLMRISASIHVESQSQKGIIIGQGGAKIKEIGTEARLELEKMFGAKVFLDLHARVEKNWSRDTRALRRLGY